MFQDASLDLRHSVRATRAPAFTLVAAVTLALGMAPRRLSSASSTASSSSRCLTRNLKPS